MVHLRNLCFIITSVINFGGCSTYQIDDLQLELLKDKYQSMLEISLPETEAYQGKIYQHEEWIAYLTVNDIKYYEHCKFKPGSLMTVPIPSGQINIRLWLKSFAGGVSYIGPAKGISGVDEINTSVKPHEILKLEIVTQSKIIYGAAGSAGCFPIFIPSPYPESFIKVKIHDM